MWVNELPKLLARYEDLQIDLDKNAKELKRLEIRIKVAESQRAIWAFYIAAMGFGLNIAVRVGELLLRRSGHL